MQKPPVILLAGGANSRFFPFNASAHKGILTLHGQTLLCRTLTNLKEHGFQKMVIVVSSKEQETGVLKSAVEACNKNLQLDIQFAIQPTPNGMGDAVLKALPLLSQEEFSQVAILSPYHITAGELLDKMLLLDPICICTSGTTTPHSYGIIHFTQDGKVDGIVEKPLKGSEPSQQKVLSLYLVSNHFLETLQQTTAAEYSFEKALDICLKETPISALQLNEPMPTLKYPWDLFHFQKFFFKKMISHVSSSASVAETAVIDESEGPVYIDEGATVSHSTRIVGPAYIGKNTLIGDFCLVRESSIEEGVKIGAHSEIARSIFMPKSTIHRGYVGDSIIGTGTKLGAGFLTANKRFDRKSIPVEVKGKLVDSEKKAFGVLIGDQTQIGTRVNTMPGICIGSHVTIFPDSIIYRNIPDNTTIHPAAQEEKK